MSATDEYINAIRGQRQKGGSVDLDFGQLPPDVDIHAIASAMAEGLPSEYSKAIDTQKAARRSLNIDYGKIQVNRVLGKPVPGLEIQTNPLTQSPVSQEGPTIQPSEFQLSQEQSVRNARQEFNDFLSNGLVPVKKAIEGISPVEKGPQSGLSILARGSAETALQAGEFITKNIPVTPSEVGGLLAGSAIGGMAVKYGLLAAAQKYPRAVMKLLSDAVPGESVESILNRAGALFNERTGGGVLKSAQEVNDFKDLFAKMYVHRTLGRPLKGTPFINSETAIEPVAPMEEPGILPEAPRPVVPPETAEVPSPAPQEPPKVSAAPPVTAQPTPTPPAVSAPSEAAGATIEAPGRPLEAPPVAVKPPEQPAVSNKEPHEVTQQGFYDLAKDLHDKAGEPLPSREVLDEARTQIVKAARDEGKHIPDYVKSDFPDLFPTAEPDRVSYSGISALTKDEFAKRFPNVPADVYRKAIAKSLSEFKPVPREVLAENLDLVDEHEANLQAEYTKQEALDNPKTPLLNFIRKRGGISKSKAEAGSYIGELENARGRGIIRLRGGLGVSHMAEIAHEAKLIPEHSENALFDRLDKELRESMVSEEGKAYGPSPEGEQPSSGSSENQGRRDVEPSRKDLESEGPFQRAYPYTHSIGGKPFIVKTLADDFKLHEAIKHGGDPTDKTFNDARAMVHHDEGHDHFTKAFLDKTLSPADVEKQKNLARESLFKMYLLKLGEPPPGDSIPAHVIEARKNLGHIVSESQLEFKLDAAAKSDATLSLGKSPEKVIAKAAADIKKAGDKIGKRFPGNVIADQLASRGFVDFRGTKIDNVRQLAEVVAAFRHPKIEHFQVVYLKDGKIVAHQVISSGLANAAVIPVKFHNRIRRTISKMGADAVWLAHNHPGGVPSPSSDDVLTTKKFSKEIPQVKGHLVTNDKQFAHISRDGKHKLLDFEKEKQDYRPSKDFLSQGNILATSIREFSHGRGIGVIFLDNRSRILSIDNIGSGKNLAEYIKQKKVAYGSTQFAISCSREDFNAIQKNSLPSGISDVVVRDGKEFRALRMEDERLVRGLSKIASMKLPKGGYYQVQDPGAEYGTDQFAVAISKSGIKTGTELTLRKGLGKNEVIDSELMKAGEKVTVVDVNSADRQIMVKTPTGYAVAGLEHFEETRVIPAKTPKGAPVKQQIVESTGIKKPGKEYTLDELQLLRQKYINQGIGARAAEKQVRRDARASLLNQFRSEKVSVDEIKSRIVDYAKEHLPPSDRGRALIMVRDARTPVALARAFSRIDLMESDLYRKSQVKEIQKTWDRVKDNLSVAGEYRKMIGDIIGEIELSGHRESTYKRIRATQDYINSQRELGNDVKMPQYVLDQVKILTKTKVSDLSEGDLEVLLDGLHELESVGRTYQAVRQATRQLRFDRALSEVIADVVPMERAFKNDPTVIDEPTLLDAVGKTLAKIKDAAWNVDYSLMPIDELFNVMGGYKGYKDALTRWFKTPFDSAYPVWRDAVRQDLAALDKVVTGNKLTTENSKRIGIYAELQQDGGREKLLSMGFKEDFLNNLKLSDGEHKAYLTMRGVMDSTFGQTADLLMELKNVELGRVNNYFPRHTNYEAMTGVAVEERLLADMVFRSREPGQGFTKRRSDFAKTPVDLDSFKVFARHMEAVRYYISHAEALNLAGKVAYDKRFLDAAGNVNQRLVVDYLDVMNKMGGSSNAGRIAVVDFLRVNQGVATLCFNLSSMLVQPITMFNAAAAVGGTKTFASIPQLLTSKKLRNFMYENFTELRERLGDDPAFKELDFGAMRKIVKVGFAGLQHLDGVSAYVAAFSAYKSSLKKRGIPLDINKPDAQGIEEATRIMRRTQVSPMFKDLCLALSRGNLTGYISLDKALLHFKTFVVGEWSFIKHDIVFDQVRDMPGADSNKWKAAMFIILGILAETYWRQEGMDSVYDSIYTALGIKHKKRQPDSFSKRFMMQLLSKPPLIGEIPQILMSKYQTGRTGVPVLDTLVSLSQGASQVASANTRYAKIQGFSRLIDSLSKVFGWPTAMAMHFWRDYMQTTKGRGRERILRSSPFRRNLRAEIRLLEKDASDGTISQDGRIQLADLKEKDMKIGLALESFGHALEIGSLDLTQKKHDELKDMLNA